MSIAKAEPLPIAEASRRGVSKLVADAEGVALVLARAATDNGRRASLDDVIEGLGYTRIQLETMEEPQ